MPIECVGFPVPCALSAVLRYPLLTAIATRYQFTDVAMPPIIETSVSSLTHTFRECVGLPVPCTLSVVLRYPLLTAIATWHQCTEVARLQSKKNADMSEGGGRGYGKNNFRSLKVQFYPVIAFQGQTLSYYSTRSLIVRIIYNAIPLGA